MKKRFLSFVLAFILLIGAIPPATFSASEVSSGDVSAPDAASASDSPSAPVEPFDGMRDITAFDLVSDMKLGWNLGKALDSWSSDAGYSDYHNSGAYQLLLSYTDGKEGILNVSTPKTFKADNTCTVKWDTDLICDSDPQWKLGTIGFQVWNLSVEDPTPIKIKIKSATLQKKKGGTKYKLDELIGEHELVISRYGTVNFESKKFPKHLTKTLGVQGSYFTVEAELVEYPQREYSKTQYFETLWHNPLTTYDMLRKIKASGFNAVRIPITYFNHIANFTDVKKTDAVTLAESEVIDADWLARIKQLVDFCQSMEMYCIIDVHNDSSTTGWLKANTQYSDAVRAKYKRLWTQVAECFKDYNDYLLFEGFNEITNEKNTWDYPGEEDCQWVNELNQLFVDTVRATGGNNAKRFLLIQPYAGAHDQDTINALTVPRDSVSGRIIVSVHAYTPATLSWSYTDKHEITKWGCAQDYAELDDLFRRLDSTFIAKGIPVIISEFGTVQKEDTGIGTDYVDEEAAAAEAAAATGSSGASAKISAKKTTAKTAATTTAPTTTAPTAAPTTAAATAPTTAPAEAAAESSVSGSDVSGSDVSGSDVSATDISEAELLGFETIGDKALLAIEDRDDSAAGNISSRVKHAEYYVSTAKKHGITCFWWDDGTLLERQDLSYNFPSITKAMVNATSTHASVFEIEEPGEQYYTGGNVKPELNITANIAVPVSGADVVSSVALKEGTDYTVEYIHNVKLGTATAVVTGCGRFSGITYIDFPIVEAPPSGVSAVLSSIFTLTGDSVSDFLIWVVTIPLFGTLGIIAYVQQKNEKERLRKLALVEEATNEAMREVAANRAAKRAAAGTAQRRR